MSLLSINITEFAGRFHPVLVHLPVGILLLAALFIILSKFERFQSLREAITISLFLGALSAIASCVTGFLLSKTESYEPALLFKHQWFAVSTALISVVAFFLHLKNRRTEWIAGMIVILIMITGHLGGSITHGSDFLTKAFTSGTSKGGEAYGNPILNVQESHAFKDVIKPILDARCVACHGPNKQKGKVRLDEPEFILKGGENGLTIVPGKPMESMVIKRIILRKDNKDHMPPIEKPQLNAREIDLLSWWIASGADFDRQVKDLEQNDKIKSILKSLESGKTTVVTVTSFLPEQNVEKASEAAIKKLHDRGVAIVPIAQNGNYLSANFVAVESFTGNDLQMLESVKKQLIWLNLGNLGLTDSNLEAIGKLFQLRMLHLQKTKIGDQGIKSLSNLSELQYLNLGATNVTVKGVEQLSGLKNLRQLFLYQTAISGDDLTKLKRLFPKTYIETGGFEVPKLDSDTTVLKAPVIK